MRIILVGGLWWGSYPPGPITAPSLSDSKGIPSYHPTVYPTKNLPENYGAFESRITPRDDESVLDQVGRVKQHLPDLVLRYLPRVSQIPLHQGMTWEPTWKAVPSQPWFRKILKEGGKDKELANRCSIFGVLPFELLAFAELVRFVHSYGEQWSQGLLWVPTSWH